MKNLRRVRATSASEPEALILLVDDHAWFRGQLAELLYDECAIETLEAENALQALTLLEGLTVRVDAVVSDERMRGMQGSDLLDHIGQRWPHIPRMLLSAYTTGEQISSAPYPVIDKALDQRIIAARICALAKAA